MHTRVLTAASWAALAIAQLFIVQLILARPASAQIEVRFFADRVKAARVTPGSDVWWFGSSVDLVNGATVVDRRWLVTPDTDANGKVNFILERDVPEVSAWFAYDVDADEWDIGSPDPWRELELDFPTTQLMDTANGPELILDQVEIPWGRVRVALIRPGIGLWKIDAVDGGPLDYDGTVNGRTTLYLPQMEGVDGASGLNARGLKVQDLVIVLDTRQYRMAVAPVDQDTLTSRILGR